MTTFLPNATLTQELLKSLLFYDQVSGDFFWRVYKNSNAKRGQKAGSLMPEGYIRITVAGRRFMAHTLAWLYMTGEYVPRGLDHRDTVRSNNRWRNLRKANKSQNRMNSRIRSDNKSGVKGVYLRPNGTFSAQITLPGQKAKQLGTFKTAEEAGEVYAAEAMKNFGEFARIK